MNNNESSVITRDESWRMFDRIARRYDLLNHLLSGGQDILWRRCVARQASETRSKCLLDLATGTADQLISICKKCPEIENAIGLDMSAGMLELGKRKIESRNLTATVDLIHGSAVEIPLANESVDLVTITFGIRNLPDVPAGLNEIHRVLKPGGAVIILEFSLPGNVFLRGLYLFYFRNILPTIGGLISGDRSAYTYLNRTVETFPYGEEFCDLMRDAGFNNSVSTREFTYGISTAYHGTKN